MFQTRNVYNLQLLFDKKHDFLFLSYRAAVYLSKVFWRDMAKLNNELPLYFKKKSVFQKHYNGDPLEVAGGCFLCALVETREEADCDPACPLVCQYGETCGQMGYTVLRTSMPWRLHDAIQNLNLKECKYK